ncbi:MAG: DUF5777 family beta-barrel protein [Saprospiraceae bacterium]|nr:DUF5777 family beta-barrel protein [Saprospiraceae bacterium]
MNINISFRDFSKTGLVLLILCSLAWTVQGQEEPAAKDNRPVRSTFSSVWLIDNQTVEVPIKGTFEMDIQHRFGIINNGYDDLFGLYAPSNIRLGFMYTIIDKLSIGFGLTKTNLSWDFNAKYAIFKQTRSGSVPVSLTYFINLAIDTREKERTLYDDFSNRMSYFHQLIIARRFSPKFSLQIAPSISHFNLVEAYRVTNEVIDGVKKNDHFAIAIGARLKVSDQTGIIFNYDIPITDHPLEDPEGNLSFGIELTSSAHAFQIFLGNFYDIIPQRNNFNNRNEGGDMLIGFNITRLWNF